MAQLLLKRTTALSSPPLRLASLLFKLRIWTKPQAPPDTRDELRSNSSCSSNHPGLWKSLLLPFPGQTTTEGFDIELVDEDSWRVSSSLGNVQDKVPDSLIRSEEPALAGEEENFGERWCPEFDEIEDMRLQKKLFYKLERDSKEYEECSFNFYRRKSGSNGKEKKRDLVSKKECASKFDAKSKLVHGNTICNNLRGYFDEGKTCSSKKKERPRVTASMDASTCKNVDSYDARTRTAERLTNQTLKHRSSRLDVHCHSEAEPESCNSQALSEIAMGNELLSGDFSVRDPFVPEIPSECSDVDFTVNSDEQSMVDDKKKRAPTYNQLTDPYHLPFCLDIYITKGSVRACIVHRVTSKVVAVAHSISKDLKRDLKSRKDASACAAVGGSLAQRALADDIHNVVYTPRKGDKIEGKLQIVLDFIIKGGIDVNVKLKQKKPFKRNPQKVAGLPG